MTYTIGAGKSFNMVLSHPDDTDPSTWNQLTALHDMRAEFTGWDPRLVDSSHLQYALETVVDSFDRLTKIIGLIQNTIKWPLLSGTPLSRWASGKIVILGDAAHAMLPYMSEGEIYLMQALYWHSTNSDDRCRNGC